MKDLAADHKIIIENLINRLEKEKSYRNVLSSMCTPPSKITQEIAGLFTEINLGDPGLFPESTQIEHEVLAELANLLNAPSSWVGSITSGGSESNLLGCWLARNWARKEKGIRAGKILFPKSAHVSFEKAADILNIEPVFISLNDKFQIDIEQVKEKIDSNTIGIVGIAGTTGTGICDDIESLSEITLDHNLFLHVDAAHGGTIYPYFNSLGLDQPKFDFENEGVKSITIDTHKMMGNLIPGGSIIIRDKSISDTISKEISYLSDAKTKQITITGTRPGNSVISAWVLFKIFGNKYQLNRVKESLDNTAYLIKKLDRIETIELVFKPIINIVGFTCTKLSSDILADLLRKKGWQLSIYSDWIRIVVMPHVSREMIDQFTTDLKDILN